MFVLKQSHIHAQNRHQMEVRGQLQAAAVLPPGTTTSTHQTGGWLRSETDLNIRLLPRYGPVRRLIATSTELSCLLIGVVHK